MTERPLVFLLKYFKRSLEWDINDYQKSTICHNFIDWKSKLILLKSMINVMWAVWSTLTFHCSLGCWYFFVITGISVRHAALPAVTMEYKEVWCRLLFKESEEHHNWFSGSKCRSTLKWRPKHQQDPTLKSRV